MSRYLEIKHIEKDKYQVVKQTHRGTAFTLKGGRFEASNGVRLASNWTPEFYLFNDVLCVRGTNNSNDKNTFTIPSDRIDKVLFAIKEYNKTYGSFQCKCNRAMVCKDCMKNLRSEVLAF